MRGSFAYLVKQDALRWKRSGTTKTWFWTYVALIAIAVVGIITVWSLKGRFDPLVLLFCTFGFPYMTFMFAYTMLHREWKNGTYGWWLTLPYPRLWLVAAKYLSALLQVLLFYAVCYVVTLLLTLYGKGLDGSLQPDRFFGFAKMTSLWYGLLIAYAPFMLAFGLLSGTVAQSRWKPLMPIMWLGFAVSGNMVLWLSKFWDDRVWNRSDWGAFVTYKWPVWLSVALPSTLLVAILFVLMSAKIVERHLTT